ncbi:hypothetical protein C8R44DRAFT_739471 [Mycena epipterygia]|nr:hypothetical protein C8R44DRAFT_739471 [Mycena epipterygia]
MTRRRVVLACTNCRRRKIRCLTSEDPSKNPCERCVKKGLKCEYLRVADQGDELPTPTSKTQTPQLAPEGHRSAPPKSAQHTSPSYSPGPPVDPQFQRTFYYPSLVLPNAQYRYPPYPNQSVALHHQSSNSADMYNRAPSRMLSTFYSDDEPPLNPPGIPGSHGMGIDPASYAWHPRASRFLHMQLELLLNTVTN